VPTTAKPLSISLPVSAPGGARSADATATPSYKGVLPALLQSPGAAGARGGAPGSASALLPHVQPLNTWPLSPTGRGSSTAVSIDAGQQLMAIETDDGSTVFMRADELAECVARLYPQALRADGSVDFAQFRAQRADSRSGATDWLWKQITSLKVTPDDISALAKQKLQDGLTDLIKDKLIKQTLGDLEDQVVAASTTYGAKAVMEAIEERLAGPEGLYQWRGGDLDPARDLCAPGDARLPGTTAGQPTQPMLLFIHGTGSSTLGAFAALAASEEWGSLRAHYGERVFGYEHRTFSKSPIDNALALVNSLPQGARLHLVTHSRGGLVGDLLCLDAQGQANTEGAPSLNDLIDAFRRQPRADEVEREEAPLDADEPTRQKAAAYKAAREAVAAQEQAKLAKLKQALNQRGIQVERYVRVASPASGTALLSDNLTVFLSGLLNLVQRGGTWAAGAMAGAIAGAVSGGVAAPAAAEAARQVSERLLKLLARVVIEIANQRMAPQVVPGIEAMLPESPMGAFLACAPRQSGIQMAVIAGDVEGGGVLKRIFVTFTDWMFFDRADNDMVVDTRSMYTGVAQRGAHARLEQGPDANHLAYFRNDDTRRALSGWLMDDRPEASKDFSAMDVLLAQAATVSRGTEPPPDNARPVVIYLPGIMGSNLKVGQAGQTKASRIWLNPLALPLGGLSKIRIEADKVSADGLIDMAYGDLARHLEQTHRVIRFDYDWRLPNEQQTARLAELITQALADHPDQPVRILAHSMGGLVVRYLFNQQPALWQRIVARDGGRLVMLGTPNHGSHLMVETLLGRSETIRTLARVDQKNRLQDLLDIVAGFPGSLQLLPRPGFIDSQDPAALAPAQYYEVQQWPGLAALNNDFWFGKHLGGRPTPDALKTASDFWSVLAGGHPGGAQAIAHTDRIAYVYGQAENTPCGLLLQKDAQGQASSLSMLGTPQGDGSVTWRSGTLDWLPADRCWLMPVDHTGLVSTPDYFDEIVALLATGQARQLARLPLARGEAELPTRIYQPGPPPGYPSERELAMAVVGGHVKLPRASTARNELQVAVRAGDVRFLPIPVLCGHYIGDPIAGAEWMIDRHLVDGALTEREHLGVHAGPLGSATVVLMPREQVDRLRGTGKGALVVGLGEYGKLTIEQMQETVCAGVLRLLLHATNRLLDQGLSEEDLAAGPGLHLASVLIGYNSTTHISIEQSVAAITLAVATANRQFGGPKRARSKLQVSQLSFIEQYEDGAITATRAARALPQSLARQLKVLQTRLTVEPELRYDRGVRQRLNASGSAYYWPRLMVTDAEQRDTNCAPECYELRKESPVPPELRASLLAAMDAEPIKRPPAPARAARHYPSKLRYLFLSERARAEQEVQQSQGGHIDDLVSTEIRNTANKAELGVGRTLYQLLVPLNFRAVAREASNLILVLDSYTANLPWEMLEVDGEPLVLKTRLVRQLTSTRYRQEPRSTRERSAYVISNPSTQGYLSTFGDATPADPNQDRLADLPGAEEEGQVIISALEQATKPYTVSTPAGERLSTDVITGLLARPYRLLVICGHGVFQVTDKQGQQRSGVVLSKGRLLTAAEVSCMGVVPDLVFLNCCHLGEMAGGEPRSDNKLAYSLARELIDMGVRCVIAAGWAVDDRAAKTFASTFFQAMVQDNEPFGHAVWLARRACHADHPDTNTWGAYQAYGDPAYTLEPAQADPGEGREPVSPAELVEWLRLRLLDVIEDGDDKAPLARLNKEIERRLGRTPAAWARRADVQFALAELLAAYGDEGFEAACTAYLRAIHADSGTGCAPLKAIEQLANLEARSAAKLASKVLATPADQTTPAQRKADLQRAADRVDVAIRRLESLQQLGEGWADTDQPNTERLSILGSAYKRQALILQAQGASWKALQPVLQRARDAYAQGEGDPSAPRFDPYGMVNRLQLDALLGTPAANTADLVALCRQAAKRRFDAQFDFWSGATGIDADVTEWLALPWLSQPAPGSPRKRPRKGDAAQAKPPERKTVAELAEQYQGLIRKLKAQPRELDSVISQLQLLAELFKAKGRPKAGQATDEQLASELAALVKALKPQ
jgi:CHAT domain-containing protein/pimeloyl-ACP methyl ester carboxylesterase